MLNSTIHAASKWGRLIGIVLEVLIKMAFSISSGNEGFNELKYKLPMNMEDRKLAKFYERHTSMDLSLDTMRGEITSINLAL